jgi:hypothetical protein
MKEGLLPKIILATAECGCLSRSTSDSPKPVEFRALIWQSWLLRVGHPQFRGEFTQRA